MSLKSLMCGVSLALTLTAGAASATDLPSGGLTRAEVVAWLKKDGHRAELHPNSNGVMIVTSDIEGVNYDIYFYDCAGERCRAMQYAAGWSGAGRFAGEINGWNKDFRYLRTYMTGDSLWTEYDVDLSPGGTWEQLDASLVRFRQMIMEFKGHFGL